MAESFIGNVIEFLIGFILVPIVIEFAGIFLITIVSPAGTSPAQIASNAQTWLLIIKGAILVLLFFIRKMVAAGLLTELILDFAFGFAIPSIIGINVPIQ